MPRTSLSVVPPPDLNSVETEAGRVITRLFGWTSATRDLPSASVLSSISVTDVEIDSSDSASSAAEVSELFADALPLLIGRFRADHVLTLNIRGVGRRYFSSIDFITSQLASTDWRFAVTSIVGPVNRAIPDQDVGNLFFECPPSSFASLPYRHWLYQSPFIDIEGYLSSRSVLGTLCEYYFQPDTWERFQLILDGLVLAFRIWPDGDGMTVVSRQSEAARVTALLAT